MLGLFKSLIHRQVDIKSDTLITKADYVVIDTELTGLNVRVDSIVSICGIRMTGGKIDVGRTFYRLIKPKKDITAESVIINEIMPSDVVKEPGIDRILPEFLQFCGSNIIVGHCISVDIEFLNKELTGTKGSSLKNPFIDTLSVYEWLRKRVLSADADSGKFPLLKDCGLYQLARFFEIPISGVHNAMVDAFIIAQIFQRFIPTLIEYGINNIGDLLEIGDPLKGGELLRPKTGICNF
jgi:DNA polymerase III subunit epsilon